MVDDPKKKAGFGVVSNDEAARIKAEESAKKAAAEKAAQEKLIAERAAAARLAEFNRGRAVGRDEGIAIGKHQADWKKMWAGAGLMFVCLVIGSIFNWSIQSVNRDQNMIESRVAVGAAISNAKLLGENDAAHPVVEQGSK